MHIELHTATSFSFLEGASLPEDLIAEAARLGYPALALCDRDGVYGAPRFHKAATEAGVRPLVGCEISLDLVATGIPAGPPNLSSRDAQKIKNHKLGKPVIRATKQQGNASTAHDSRLTVLVENRRGYQNLCRLLTRMHLGAPKGEGRASWDDIERYSAGLIALTNNLRDADRLRSIFGPKNLYVEIQRHFRRDQERYNRALIDYARYYGLPLLATNGVRYAKKSGRRLFDALTSIRKKTVLDQAGRLLDANAERHLKSPAEMAGLFRDLPEAIRNTKDLAARLEFTLENLGYEFPNYPVPPSETMISYLCKITDQGARERYRPYHERARRQIEHELRVIDKLNLAGYFLIVWDMVRFCRENRILAQGRGSAANSAVCYSLGITAVDPVGMELLFERFLSEERGEWPDIDIDLPSGDQREKALQHVYEQYGPRGAGMTANVITYRGKSAVREIGKVLGFPEEMIGRLSNCIHSFEYTDDADKLANQVRTAGFDTSHPRVKHLVKLCLEIQNLPRHLGQHSGGMVICRGDLDSIVPLENARMSGRVVVQWDKDDCTDLGIIKVDLLGLGMMAALEESIQIIRSRGGEVDLAHLPPDDPKTYAMIQKADTIGAFQIESRAQMATLPRLKPKCFYDLVVEVAIIRPGPIVGNMVHPYINRRLGREPVCYPHPSLEPILKRTLGVPLFQEQLLRLAMVAAGFTGGEAEELRRAMGFKRSAERMQAIEEKLRRGLAANNIHGQAAEDIVRSITSFALYGFPESHAASFALLAYASCYLKTHYPAAFYTALLNCQPMGFYSPAVLVKDAQRHGIRVRPIDVQFSDARCQVEDEAGDKAQGTKDKKVGTGNPSGLSAQSWDVLGPRFQGSGGIGGTGNHAGQKIGQVSNLPQGMACRAPTATDDRTIRLGLMYVSGLRAGTAEAIEQERRKQPFASIDDLVGRIQLRKPELDTLAELGALNSLGKGLHRRKALWQIEKAWRPTGPLFEEREKGKRTRDKKAGTGNPAGPSEQSREASGPRFQTPEPTSETGNPAGRMRERASSLPMGTACRAPTEIQENVATSKLSQTTLSDRPGDVAHAFSVPCRAFDPDIPESIVNSFPGQSTSPPVNSSTPPPLNGPPAHGSRFTAHEQDPCPLAPMNPLERLDADYRGSGMTTGPHPMHYLREPLHALGVLPAVQLEHHPNGRWVRVAGAVITRQRPGTAKGFVFLTLEDETGVSNVIVTPDKFQDNRVLVTSEPFLLVEGVLQKQDGVIHVRARVIKPLKHVTLEMASHDFH